MIRLALVKKILNIQNAMPLVKYYGLLSVKLDGRYNILMYEQHLFQIDIFVIVLFNPT